MRKLGLGLICVLLAGGVAMGEGAEPPKGVTLDLFDGVSLDGWIATGCEVGVEDGLLVLQSGNGLLRTHHRYRDFELELSWRARGQEKWDSGVFFRAGEPPAPRPWPADYQINLRKGLEGELVRTSAPKPSGMVRDGQWNQFRLRVIGRTATLWINDQHAWTFDGLESDSGYIGLQAEVPGGGQFEFKDIRVTRTRVSSVVQRSGPAGVGGGQRASGRVLAGGGRDADVQWTERQLAADV